MLAGAVAQRARERNLISQSEQGKAQYAVLSLASPTPRAGIFDIKPRCAANRAHAPRQRFHWMWWPRPLLFRPELSERDADAACRVERLCWLEPGQFAKTERASDSRVAKGGASSMRCFRMRREKLFTPKVYKCEKSCLILSCELLMINYTSQS
jgi:hypothetical protein